MSFRICHHRNLRRGKRRQTPGDRTKQRNVMAAAFIMTPVVLAMTTQSADSEPGADQSEEKRRKK